MINKTSREFCTALFAIFLFSSGAANSAVAGCHEPQDDFGTFFSLKNYTHSPLPTYGELKNILPSPIYDKHPEWIETYWKAWKIAFTHFYEPTAQNHFVSQYIDAGFNENVFLWDSSFMTFFTNFASPLVPGISTLDNFYARQHRDGEISREIVRDTGMSYEPWVNHECGSLMSRIGWANEPEGVHPVKYVGRSAPTPNPIFTLDTFDHPILAWAELESYRVTGDRERLARVWQPLVQHYRAFQKYLQQGNGLYITGWSSMDNSPRNEYLQGGGTGVDTSAEMALFARCLSTIATLLDKPADADAYSKEAAELSKTINRLMWNRQKNFYFDLTGDGEQAPVRTIAAYWTLIAHVASSEQAAALVDELSNPKTFGRPNAVPTLSADEPLYNPAGGYWRGSVWAPTTTMVIKGLEEYGYFEVARRIALQHVGLVASVYERTGTIWENYSPEKSQPGVGASGYLGRKDFVGWSGLGPIMYLLEYGIGLRPDAAHNILTWQLAPGERLGCKLFRFNGHVVSLLATPTNADQYKITVQSDGSFTLKVSNGGDVSLFNVEKGDHVLNASFPHIIGEVAVEQSAPELR